MALPLHEQERCYNATVVPEGLQRTRPPLHPEEPEHGHCIVWRVLGFGGKPNPLIFARAASFAARTAQALLSPKRRKKQRRLARRKVKLAAARLELYVDDPVLALAGSSEQIDASIDLCCLWWTLLGVPLAWGKGQVADPRAQKFSWIGVDFHIDDNGRVIMSSPTPISRTWTSSSPLCATARAPSRTLTSHPSWASAAASASSSQKRVRSWERCGQPWPLHPPGAERASLTPPRTGLQPRGFKQRPAGCGRFSATRARSFLCTELFTPRIRFSSAAAGA